jgi:hypothetical protein
MLYLLIAASVSACTYEVDTIEMCPSDTTEATDGVHWTVPEPLEMAAVDPVYDARFDLGLKPATDWAEYFAAEEARIAEADYATALLVKNRPFLAR